MDNINDLYKKLSNDYDVKWLEKENVFYLYFIRHNKKYRLYISEDLLQLEQCKKMLKYHYWKDLGHKHYDDISFNILYDEILNYIKK